MFVVLGIVYLRLSAGGWFARWVVYGGGFDLWVLQAWFDLFWCYGCLLGLCDDDADLRFASWLLFSLLVWLGDFVVCSVVIALIVLYWCVYCAGFLGVCIFGLLVSSMVCFGFGFEGVCFFSRLGGCIIACVLFRCWVCRFVAY